jgi:hypothetical protein
MYMASSRLRFGARVLVVWIALSASAVQAQDPQPGEAKGKAVGTAIKTAIGVAFPAVSEIISAIWPNRDKSKKGTDADVTKAIADFQSKTKTAVARQLNGVNGLVAELRLVDSFASNASKANTFIFRLDALLSASPTTDDQWADISRVWGNAAVFLDRILAIKADDVRKTIADDTDQADILGFLDNLAVAKVDIASFLAVKKATAMRDPVGRVGLALDGFRLKGSVRLNRLATDIASIPDAIPAPPVTTGQPPPPPPPPPAVDQEMLDLVNSRLRGSRKQ